MTFQEALSRIGDIFTIYEIVKIILFILATSGFGFLFSRVFWRKEKRLFDNLKNRKILIFAPPESSKKNPSQPEDMKMELDLLKKTGYFKNLPKEIFQNTSHEKLEKINSNTLVIIGYNKKFNKQSLLKILDKSITTGAPIIFYAYEWIERNSGAEIKLKGYPYHSKCETGLRLINDVFTTLATYPYEQKNN